MNSIDNYYLEINGLSKFNKDFCVLFVFNTDKEIRDNIHTSECITDTEKMMIINSFRKSFTYVYEIPGENHFIENAKNIQKKHKYILVYSMAQNIDGVGRRSLIPLLCDYFGFINIGSSIWASTLGGNKMAMQYLIERKYKEILFPFTIHISHLDNIEKIVNSIPTGSYILKPNSESASIGVEKLHISKNNRNYFINYLTTYQKKYPNFCIQEFIQGDEVEVPLIFLDQEIYCPGVCLIEKKSDFLDYDTVELDNYEFRLYSKNINSELIGISKQIAQCLGFDTICRVDYIINGQGAYIIDIGPNPTISRHSSTNFLFRNLFYNDETFVYRLLAINALISHKLFKPSFNESK